MAIAKIGPILSDISGSVGETTYFRQRGRLLVKSKNTGYPGPTSKQETIRNLVRDAVNVWQAYTEPERQAWIIYAREIVSPGIFNKNRYLAGYHMFLKRYLTLTTNNIDPGALFPIQTIQVQFTSIEFDQLTSSRIRFIAQTDFNPDYNRVQVMASDNMPASFTNGKKYLRVIDTNTDGLNGHDYKDSFNAYYGHDPDPGARIFFQLRYIHMNEGKKSIPFKLTGIVA